MASRTGAEESSTILRDSCGDTSTPIESVQAVQENPKYQVRHSNSRIRKLLSFRSIGSSSLLLILTWHFIIQCSINITTNRMQYVESNEERDGSLWFTGEAPIGATAIYISCPIASLLAEVVISRYKLVSFALKALWLLSIVDCIISVCAENLPVAKATLFNIQLLLLLTPQYFLQGVFTAIAVPMAVDQINGGSNANISAFIQWLLWCYYSATAVSNILGSFFYTCSNLKASEVSITMSLLPVLLLSVGLILDFSFHHKLVKEPVTVNPVSLIFKVLKYAAKHKYPVQRSAFTYCENEEPTRLDYGKSKYGGPFTNEQVEDVKTFWRILLVILVISLVTTPLSANSLLVSENSSSQAHCIWNVLYNTISFPASVMFFIPLYELLIYPCLRNRSPSILKSIGIGAAAVVISSFYGIMVEFLRPIITNSTTECIIMTKDHNVIEVSIGIPLRILLGLTATMLLKCYMEFICAQAPYNMNGLLIGILLCLYCLYYTLGVLPYEAWRNNWFGILDNSKCGIWFYLTTLILAVVSSALLGLVIRLYKARERDEIIRYQNLVEEVYHKYQENETR